MSLKTIQQQWYEILKEDGFEDLEDIEQESRPLKTWSGNSNTISLDEKVVSLIDLFIHQPPICPIISSFPEPLLSKKDAFIISPEFQKACDFICKHGNNTLTPVMVTKIWQKHCDGIATRMMQQEFMVSHVTIHRTIAKLTEWMDIMGNMDTYEDEPKKITVIIRPYKHETDAPFIYTSWRNALWYDEERPESESTEFYRKSNKYIRTLLSKDTTKVKVACFADDRDQIVGYSVITKTNLEWVYIKIGSRKQGVASLLCKGFKTITEPSTKLGLLIKNKKELRAQGESNGESNKD